MGRGAGGRSRRRRSRATAARWGLLPPNPPVGQGGDSGGSPAGRWYWGAVYAITCDEVFVRGGVGMNIARVRLDALGPGTPPD
ncbi:MAG: hypothetical protein HY908_27310 [Myxococcales bacterium]|nr:hypothetical protein [Myxococcales bacterium]